MPYWRMAETVPLQGGGTCGLLTETASRVSLFNEDVPAVPAGAGLDAFIPELTATGLVSGAIATYLAAKRSLLRRQAEFWEGVLPPAVLQSYGIVRGGYRSRFADQVRMSLGLPRAVHALTFRALLPIATTAFDAVEEWEEILRRMTRMPVSVRTVASTIRGLLHSLTGSVDGRHGRLLKTLSRSRPELYMTLGGPVSNDMAFAFSRETARRRVYRLAAMDPNDAQRTPRLLETSREMASLRRRKRRLIVQSGGVEAGERTLDENICYAICRASQPGSSELLSLVSYPHERTRASEGEYVYDAFLLLCGRSRFSVPGGAWILSAQPLHVLGGACTEIFWHPNELLGTGASEFRAAMREAMDASGGGGFEAVFEVRAHKGAVDGVSPRLVERVPAVGRSELEVRVVGPPLPIAPSEA